jgi:hypothetical protein
MTYGFSFATTSLLSDINQYIIDNSVFQDNTTRLMFFLK